MWSEKFFSQSVWKLVELTEGYHYNRQFSRRGNKRENRRWQKGPFKGQINWIKITTDFDEQWTTSEDDSVKDEPSVKDVDDKKLDPDILKMFREVNPNFF